MSWVHFLFAGGQFGGLPHPRHDVVVKAVDKVHQFDPEQTHPVDLLVHVLFDLDLLGCGALQLLSDVCKTYE